MMMKIFQKSESWPFFFKKKKQPIHDTILKEQQVENFGRIEEEEEIIGRGRSSSDFEAQKIAVAVKLLHSKNISMETRTKFATTGRLVGKTISENNLTIAFDVICHSRDSSPTFVRFKKTKQ